MGGCASRRAAREADPVLIAFAVVGGGVRMLTLPLFALVDLSWWPLARATVARSGWTVVRVDFHGVDAEFVRVVGEVATQAEAETLRREIAARNQFVLPAT